VERKFPPFLYLKGSLSLHGVDPPAKDSRGFIDLFRVFPPSLNEKLPAYRDPPRRGVRVFSFPRVFFFLFGFPMRFFFFACVSNVLSLWNVPVCTLSVPVETFGSPQETGSFSRRLQLR